MSWRIPVTVVLLVLAAVGGWALWSHDDAGETQQAQTGGRADYVLHDFEMVALDDQGRESFTLRAPRLERDPGDESLAITTPLFLVPPGEGSSSGDAWEIRAQHGWVSAGGEELRLRGEVLATSDGATGAPVEIATEQLSVFPETDRVASPVAVSINRPGSILRGLGLEVNLATKQYVLESEVHSRYVP